MDEDIVFYYAVWSNVSDVKHTWWINLLFSITTLRSVYKKNKIKVICYTKVPKEFFDYSSLLCFEIISIKPWYENYNKIRFGTNYLSKLRDCFEIAFKEKVILLDSDVFTIKKFTNINWEKVGVCGNNHLNVNTGVLIFDTTKKASREYEKMFIKKTDEMLDQTKNLSEYVLQVHPLHKNMKINEEVVTRHIFKDKNFTDKFFYNIGSENNGIIKEEKSIVDPNNIHLVRTPPHKIAKVVMNINYFKNIIFNFLKKTNSFHIIEKIKLL